MAFRFERAALALMLVAFAAPAPPPGGLRLDINIPAFRIELRRGERVVARYRIAVGQASHPTPTGRYLIERVEANPAWTPPETEWAANARPMAPGPANPMGRAKLLFLPLYYIHGSPDSASRGSAASHGCVRMSNTDILALAAEVLRDGLPGMAESSVSAMLADDRRTRAAVLERPVPLDVYYRPIEAIGTDVLVHHDVYRLWSDSLAEDTHRRLTEAVWPRPLPAATVPRLAELMRALTPGESLTIPLDSTLTDAGLRYGG